MLNVRLNLRKVAAIVACLAVCMMFAGCEKEKEVPTYIYTASAGSGGTISPDGAVSISQGEDMTFTATPDNGKTVNEWLVNGNAVATSGNSYTVTNVQSNGTVQVTFKDYIIWQLTSTMTATLDDKGVLTISTTKEAEDMPPPRFENLPEGGWMLFPFWIKDSIDYRDKILTGVIEDRVTSIVAMAFHFCTSLTSVTIPNSVKIIDGSAFGGCHVLTSVTIPNSVTTIGLNAFRECIALTSITIPNSVTTIASEAFVDCTSLTSITIPSSVTSLGDNILYGCTGLKDVKVEWTTPPSKGLVYFAISATLHVPAGTKELYQAVPQWGNIFETIVEY